MSKERKTSLPLIKQLARNYLKSYILWLVIAFGFMVIASGMTAGIALLMKPVLDGVLPGHSEDVILRVSGFVFICFFLRGISTYIYTLLMAKVGQFVIADVQKQLFSHFLGLELAFFHSNPSGQLISRMISDVNVMRAAFSDTLTGFGKSFLTLIFLVAVMFYRDWQLACAAFVIFPFMAGFVVFLGRKLRHISGSVQSELAGLTDILSQIFHGIRQVQAYGMESKEEARAAIAIDKVKKLNVKSVRVGNLSTPVNEILVGIILGGVISYGGYQAAAGNMTPGDLGSFLVAFIMAYEPMKKLARLNNTLQTGLGATERVFEMLDRQSAIVDKKGATPLKVSKPEITFKDVAFQYEETDLKALNKVSFTAKSGKVTALVGPSGGGKSTIINLIPRFYDALSGEITIEGQKLTDVTIESLRANIALVSQDITIFDDTIAANIAYGSVLATKDEIVSAAKAAAAHDFIEGFPEGYDTRVGEEGVKLSGGQRQRIAIARAILRDAPILLLDEATSALDNESEKAIQEALEKLEKGRTTIVIAHRLSTVQSADQIIVLDKGGIVEKGTHSALLKKGGIFAKMHAAGLRDVA